MGRASQLSDPGTSLAVPSGSLPRILCCFSEGQEMLKRLTHSLKRWPLCRQASWEQGLPFLPNTGMNLYEEQTRKAHDLSYTLVQRFPSLLPGL